MYAKHLSLICLALAALAALSVADDLVKETLKEGDCSQKAQNGDSLAMHYEGKLDDGSEFDSSYKRKEPLELTLGSGMVIKGWDEGLLGMCVGEVRQLTIPPSMGYGEAGYPPVIPASATLHFKVELVKINGGSGADAGEL